MDVSLKNMIHFYSSSDVSVAKISVAAIARVVIIAAYDHYFGYVNYYCEYLLADYYELSVPKYKIDLRLLQDLSLFKVL